MPMRTSVIEVNRQKAAEYMKLNTGNVPLKPSKVEYFEDILRRDEWRLTHQGIAISAAGRLLDGQHRLQAIINANVTVSICLTTDAPDDSFDAIDMSPVRRLADVVKKDSHEVETLRFLYRITEGGARLTAQHFRQYYELLGARAHKLLEFSPTRTRYLSASPVRAAAVFLMWSGKDADTVLLTYDAIVNRRYKDLPPAAEAFVKQIDSAQERIGRMGRFDLFARAMLALDPDTSELKRLQVKDVAKHTSSVRVKLQRALGMTGNGSHHPVEPAVAARPKRHLASKPDKAACISDFHAVAGKMRGEPTRSTFMKKGLTGRRYEKLWKSWDSFVAAAARA